MKKKTLPQSHEGSKGQKEGRRKGCHEDTKALRGTRRAFMRHASRVMRHESRVVRHDSRVMRHESRAEVRYEQEDDVRTFDRL